MKNCHVIFVVTLFLTAISCNKNKTSGGLTSLNIINAEAGIPSIYVYLTLSDSAFYLQQSALQYGSCVEYGIPSGTSPLTLINSIDTTKTLLQADLHVTTGGIYSLYLSGQYPNVDTLLRQDSIPVNIDSVAGLRFINLSSGSQAMTVNLQGNPSSQTEFSGLGYKMISSFRTYPDTSGITSYIFEVRDQASGNLLFTFTWNFTLYRNNTIVIDGSEDPTSLTPIGGFQVNNF